MKKRKLKSKNYKVIWQDMVNAIYEGWKVVTPPRKNWLGYWVVKLIKT